MEATGLCGVVTRRLSLVFANSIYNPTWTSTISQSRPGFLPTCQHAPVLEINCCPHCIRSLSTSGCIPGCYSSYRIQHVSANRWITENIKLSEVILSSTSFGLNGSGCPPGSAFYLINRMSRQFFTYTLYPQFCSHQNDRHCHIQQVLRWSRSKRYHQRESQELPIDIRCQVRDPTLLLTCNTYHVTPAGFLKVFHLELPLSITWVLPWLGVDQTLSF